MVFIYVLQLEHNKYYVGKTTNPEFRLQQHFNSSGSQWTKKYKPINVLEIIPNCDDYDEDKYTIKQMEKYGIDNVRGGSFCEITLNEYNLFTIKQMLNGATDKCYICDIKGHYATECIKQKKTTSTINKNKDMNEKCDCPTSYFSKHRKSKCLLNKIISSLDDDDNND